MERGYRKGNSPCVMLPEEAPPTNAEILTARAKLHKPTLREIARRLKEITL